MKTTKTTKTTKTLKTCTKCKVEKELTEFSINNAAPDSLSWRCTICLKKEKVAYYQAHKAEMNASASRRYQANREAINAWHREWRNNQGLEKYKKTQAGYAERSRDKKNNYNETWRAGNQEKIRAHTAVLVAVRNGSLIPGPCEICGKTKTTKTTKTLAHHEDYSKPLDVIWLCSRCHAEHHRTA